MIHCQSGFYKNLESNQDVVLISDLNTERNGCQLQVIVTSRAWKSKFISLLYFSEGLHQYSGGKAIKVQQFYEESSGVFRQLFKRFES